MADSNDITNLADLKKRVAALGPYKLVITDTGAQLVIEHHQHGTLDELQVVFAHQNDGDDDLVEHWLEPRERERLLQRSAGKDPYPTGATERDQRVLDAVRRVAGLALEEETRLLEELRPFTTPEPAEREGDDAIFSIAGLVDVLAQRLHANGSLGRGHDIPLFNLLEREVERECERAV